MTKSRFQKWLDSPAPPSLRRGRADLTNDRWLRGLWSNPAVEDYARAIFVAGQRAAQDAMEPEPLHMPESAYRPHMMPKVRSETILKAVRGYPCTARISSIIPGHRCAAQSTVVACHAEGVGKGVATKVSDAAIFAGCLHCHDLYDMRDKRWHWLMEHHPQVTYKRILAAVIETQTLLAMHEQIAFVNADWK